MLIILLVYVDDIIITGTHSQLIDHYIARLNSQFALKDLGTISYFLGIQVTLLHDTIHLSQHKYITDLLLRASMFDCHHASTPMSTASSLSLYDGDSFSDPTLYRSIVGALQYCTITRPDISFAVNKVCQYMHAPTTQHWLAVKRILRYLKGTSTHGITLHRSSDLPLTCYSDADWASSPDDRKSTSGYCCFLGPNLISWSSGKQRVVSRSSAESEYRGLANAAAELIWVEQLLSELQFSLPQPPVLFYDNTSARDMAHNPVMHARTKHIEIDYHFIRDRIVNNALVLQYTPSDEQLADIMTKALPAPRFQNLRTKLTVLHIPVSLRGDVKTCNRAE